MAERVNFSSPFEASRRMEEEYAAELRGLAREIDRIVGGFPVNEDNLASYLPRIESALRRYRAGIEPWAASTADKAVNRLNDMNKRAWAAHSRNLSKRMREHIQEADIARVIADYKEEQAAFIGDVITDAADRVAKLQDDVLLRGKRASVIAKELEATGKVSASRATLIARTEVARTSNGLTRARAEYVGSESYTWRTARDGDVRLSHREMEGREVSYAVAPLLSDNTSTHAGEIYNCRCWQEPNIPDSYF